MLVKTVTEGAPRWTMEALAEVMGADGAPISASSAGGYARPWT